MKKTVEGYQLSPQQTHLWALQQAGGDLPYGARCAVLLEGPLDAQALSAAVGDVVERHEILRTSFDSLPSMAEPLQVIGDEGGTLARGEDLSGLTPEEQGHRLEALFGRYGEEPFDFGGGQPLRASLVTLSPSSHVLFITLPGLCADAASLDILVDEIGLAYAARSRGERPSPEEVMQYADFAAWQNALLEEEATAEGVNYWRRLNLSTRSVSLPFRGRAAGAGPFTPAVEVITLDPGTTAALLDLSRSQADASAHLLTCWLILLWRLTGEADCVVGALYDGRTHEEVERAIGLHARYLPVTCSLNGAATFRETLRLVAGVAAEREDWQAFFSWSCLGESGGEGQTPPFFPVCFEFEEWPAAAMHGGVSFKVYRRSVCVDRFRLKLSCALEHDSLVLRFHFDRNDFRAEEVGRLAAYYEVLLRSAVENPASAIARLEILPAGERRRVLEDFNRTVAPYAEGKCVHQHFEEQAEKTPHAVAVRFEERALTYAEVNARANRLAHHLRGLGVGPDVPVGICLERSEEMFTSILGVLKAGGAYLPLDASLPKERIALILEEAAADVVIAQRRTADKLPAAGLRVVDLDADGALLGSHAAANPESGVSAGHLVYVLFTSGSTGTPKGVAVEHRQLLNYLRGVTAVIGLDDCASFATVSTFAADLGHTVLFPPMLNGGCLHVIAQERATDPAALAEYYERYGIDCLKIVPSHLSALLASGADARVLPRRRLILGGEKCRWELIERVRALSPGCRVFNHYGPTETTVGALVYEVADEGPDERPAAPPIGRPIANVEAYVLDAALNPVPVGVTGELYLGGEGLARGYWRRPALSASRFVPHPFSGGAGGRRLYRTGDAARRLAGGEVEYVGRVDRQVKVRGHRVELGEVEAALRRHQGLRDAVVTARNDARGEQRLVAYIVRARERLSDVAGLREFLGERLPDYMLPAAFVVLDALPLTPNGKLNVAALPEPTAENRLGEEADYAAPRSEVEEVLASVWQNILGVPAVGVNDNYFALGGDSILVVRMLHELAAYGLSATVADVLERPTVRALAGHIERGGRERGVGRPPLELLELPGDVSDSLPPDAEDAYPLARMQELMIHHYRHDRQGMGVYHNQQSFHLYDENFSPAALRGALEYVVQKHPTLRTVFVNSPTAGMVQVVRREVPCRVREDDLTGLSEAEQEAYLDQALADDRRELFDVGNPNEPLFRFRVFKRSPNSLDLLMSFHHAIKDGWGNIEFLNDLIELYMSMRRGEQVPAPLPQNTYKEFVALEKEIIASPEAADFWRGQLANRTRARFAWRTPPGDPSGPIIYNVEPGLAHRLQGLAKDLAVSGKALFLSCYLDLVAGRLGEGSATVGVVTNGRSERLTDPLKAFGLFWNIVPFCHGAGSRDRVAQIRSVQQRLIDIEPYGRYPLAQMLEDTGQEALFDATFNFIHFHNTKLIPAASGARLLGVRAHDKFHFPLNYVVAVNSQDAGVSLRVEYDKAFFDADDIRRMNEEYAALLEGLTVA